MNKKYVKLVEDKIKIIYSAIVLTEQSRQTLLKAVTPLYEEVIAHHMTINMGPLSEHDRSFLGQTVKLQVTSLASDDKVQAVGVKQLQNQPLTKNPIPHITISVNRNNGGKPVLSNKLTNWQPIDNFIIEGIVEEL